MGLTAKVIKMIKAVMRSPIIILHVAWAVPAVLLIRLLRPLRIIRLGPLRNDRIGHFAADAGQQYAIRQLQSGRFFDLYYWLTDFCSNSFWESLVRRNFYVRRWVRYIDYFNQRIPGGSIHHRPSSWTDSMDIYGYLEKAPRKMVFTPEEDERALTWLAEQGWQENSPFVCLLVRDSAYLKNDSTIKAWKSKSKYLGNEGWDYLNYRDTDIANYAQAAKWLAGQGVWVLRMGRIMAKPFPLKHQRVIDYAFHPGRSDFLDVWLFAHCDLCISTGTGPDMISDVYRRPILFLNYLVLKYLFSWSDAMHLPKNLYWSDSGAPLTLREHLKHDYLYTHQYREAGIEYAELNPEQILAAVMERWQRIRGLWVDTPQDIARNNLFWEIMTENAYFKQPHRWIHPEARVGAAWLREVGHDFLK